MTINYYFAAIISFMLIACNSNSKIPVRGKITINYNLNKVKGVEPSYQTVIWLEDTNGNYLKSFLVSEYLSYGGYNDSTICPNWSAMADWDSVSDEIFDAVTSATPPVGQNELIIDLEREKLPPGRYRYCIQIHIIEQYNILYIGEIEIGNNRNRNIATPVFVPDKHSLAFNALENVIAEYTP